MTDAGAHAPVPEVQHAIDPVVAEAEHVTVFELRDLDFYYGAFRAVRDVTLDVHEHEITALIG
ncbi:MAG TPA: hypothetical protein VF230_10685, partial [Acidimicrobiales bacterium]